MALIPPLSLNPPMRGGKGREIGDREQRKTAAHSTVKKNHPPVAVMRPPFLNSGFRFRNKGLKNTHLSVKPQWNKDMWQLFTASSTGSIIPLIRVKLKEQAWENLMSASEKETDYAN